MLSPSPSPSQRQVSSSCLLTLPVILSNRFLIRVTDVVLCTVSLGDLGPSAGPFGYTEKGTFFIDSHTTGFPESIDMVYQGFVWAFTMNYEDTPGILHGGVHTILLDKVKKETVNLKGDHIVRITGRASPYNINRLTFYTKLGKKLSTF